MLRKEQVVDSEIIYDGKILNIRKDRVITCSDNISVREIVSHPGGVGVIALDDNNKIFLVKQYRHPFEDFVLEIPAGKLEKGEDHAAAAVRELSEETGYTAGSMKYLGNFMVSPGYCTEKIHIYLATGLKKGECHFDDDEDLELYEYDFEEAYKMVMDGELCDAKTVIGILKAKEVCGFDFGGK